MLLQRFKINFIKSMCLIIVQLAKILISEISKEILNENKY